MKIGQPVVVSWRQQAFRFRSAGFVQPPPSDRHDEAGYFGTPPATSSADWTRRPTKSVPQKTPQAKGQSTSDAAGPLVATTEKQEGPAMLVGRAQCHLVI